MCFAIQVSGIILRPFYSRVRDARRDRISPSLSLNFHQTVTIRATKSNNRPANLLRARQSFVELPSTRTNFLFNSQQNATPSLFIAKIQLEPFLKRLFRFFPHFDPCHLLHLHLHASEIRFRIACIYFHHRHIPRVIYTQKGELHACKPVNRLYANRIEKRINAMEDFSMGIGYRFVCRYVGRWAKFAIVGLFG